jgi:hypothetical protein
MATRLYQIVAFAGVGAGAVVAQAHSINVNGVAWIPDFVYKDNNNFDVVVTSTTVTVTNNGGVAADVNIALELLHTTLRAFGTFGADQTHNMTPNPFYVGGSSGTGAGAIQSFRYTCTGAEGSDFTIALPAARASDVYRVQMTPAGVTNITGFDCPDVLAGDRTTLLFRVVTAGNVTAGDQFDILVLDVLT